jgi:hypothetical protein
MSSSVAVGRRAVSPEYPHIPFPVKRERCTSWPPQIVPERFRIVERSQLFELLTEPERRDILDAMTKAEGTSEYVQNQGGIALVEALAKAGSGAQTALEVHLGRGAGYVSHIIAGRFKPGWDGRVKIAKRFKVAANLWDLPATKEGTAS